MAKNKSNGLTLPSLINRWKLNKVHLASRMKMPVGTFKNKLSETQTAYKFTDEEAEQLRMILLDMADDIRDSVGQLTFNEALSKIVKK